MLASLIIALLTGMGVGSGGLFVVFLTVVEGVPQLYAQGLNLFFFIFSTATALIYHARAQKLPLARLAYVCAIGSIGCVIGATLAQNVDATLLRRLFAWLLIVSGALTFTNKKKKFQKSLYK